MTTWLVILGVGAGSYVLRALPILLGGRWTRSPSVERVLAHAGTAAIAALIAGSVRHGSSGHEGPLAVAAVVGLVLAARGASLARVLLVGGAAFALLVAVSA